MRLIFNTILLIALILGGLWFWHNSPETRYFINQYVENGEISTLEARYTPEQIMEIHSSELLRNDKYSYRSAVLKFVPYLFMEVKYLQPDQKHERVLFSGA